MAVDPAATAPVAQIAQRVADAQTLDDLPGIIKALTDQLQAVDATNTAQDLRIGATSGLLATLQSQLLWVCSGCILFGGAIGYIATKVVG